MRYPAPALWLLLAVSQASLAPIHAAEIGDPLRALKSIDREGTGHARGRDAWQKLSQADAAQLPDIMAALDDASPLAANWIRASVDAIAERQLRAGGRLPTAELERFVLDTKHAPRARRLAFDWLSRADKSAPDRLIPGMLDDPSVEFRRDAVARLLEAAERQASADEKQAAADTYRQALRGARDLDQVQQISKALAGYGQTVDLNEHFGYVLRWKLIGPFDNDDEKGFDVDYPPEARLDFAAELPGKNGAVRWIDYTSDDPQGKVDLNKALGKANGLVGYAASEFVAPAARPAEIRMTTTNANKVWLNGQLLASNKVYHAGAQMDQYVARGQLQPGRNMILIKVCQNTQKEDWAQDWDFQLRVCDASGTAILSADRASKTSQATGGAN